MNKKIITITIISIISITAVFANPKRKFVDMQSGDVYYSITTEDGRRTVSASEKSAKKELITVLKEYGEPSMVYTDEVCADMNTLFENYNVVKMSMPGEFTMYFSDGSIFYWNTKTKTAVNAEAVANLLSSIGNNLQSVANIYN